MVTMHSSVGFISIPSIASLMEPTDHRSRPNISRRTALSIIGTVGSLGLAGCAQFSGIGESASVTVINNNSSNTASVKLLSKNETVILDEEYDLNPNASPTKEYTGNASRIIVSINGENTKTVSVASSFSSCKPEQIVASVEKNGNVSVTTSCVG
jgi:hypothetical protein